jgi:ubiquitin-activating enzyme E1
VVREVTTVNFFCYFLQAGAILKAEVYGIPRPEWAADAAAVAAAAGKVAVPEFVPKKGVKIETDPKVGPA